MTKPIFLVSLPRSGSTLLQRMLAVSPHVASAAEPWALLPLWAMRNIHAGRTVYSHQTAANAINDFLRGIALGDQVFAQAVSAFGMRLYDAAAEGRKYFLDKTPRYYLMLPLIREAFPHAKIILLIRNPLAVLASICETFNKGRLWWPDYWIDWDEGHARMASAVSAAGENVTVVSYESLVENPYKQLADLCEWLDVPFEEKMLTTYRDAEFSGRMGDPHGIRKYSEVSVHSMEKWRSFFRTSFKRKIALEMLKRIGEPNLNTLGYPREKLEAALECDPLIGGPDLRGRLEYFVGRLAGTCDFRYFQARFRAIRSRSEYSLGCYRSKGDRSLLSKYLL